MGVFRYSNVHYLYFFFVRFLSLNPPHTIAIRSSLLVCASLDRRQEHVACGRLPNRIALPATRGSYKSAGSGRIQCDRNGYNAVQCVRVFVGGLVVIGLIQCAYRMSSCKRVRMVPIEVLEE